MIPLPESTGQEEEKNPDEKSERKENDITHIMPIKEKNEKDNNYLNNDSSINGYTSYKIKKMDLENRYKEEKNELEKKYIEEKNILAKKYDNLKIILDRKYKSLLEKEENQLQDYIIKLESEKKECVRFKTNLLCRCLEFTKTIENVYENDIIYKTLSLSFIKKTGDNTEKDGKELSKDDEKNNPEKREENLKRDNITSNEGNEFTEEEGDLNLTGKKRKRSV